MRKAREEGGPWVKQLQEDVMIAQLRLQLPFGKDHETVNARAKVIQDAILARLPDVGRDTVRNLADYFGISLSAVRHHLEILRGEGVVRPCTRLKEQGRRGELLWELGDDDEFSTVEGVVWTRAVQIGMSRDPLVAALFGPGANTCAAWAN
jgi:DNA-binding transcriptional ArsR family regulator